MEKFYNLGVSLTYPEFKMFKQYINLFDLFDLILYVLSTIFQIIKKT